MIRDPERFIQNSFTQGSIFDGKYRIDGLIGTGNFSHVFKARHESMDRDVAIKILKPEMKKADPGLGVRFLNEVKIVSKLHHVNSVTIFDFGETEEGIQYMVLEHIPGIDLDELLQRKKRFSTQVAVDLVLQVLSALEEAHQHNIIHRDLKPSNIMISKNKSSNRSNYLVKVLDFGVAKFVGGAQPSEGERRSTKFIGTPVYMSPEQVLGQHVSPRSDLYSVGLLLYELLTGDVPVVAKNLAAVAKIHIDDAPIPFKKIKQLPKALQSIIYNATERYPDKRFKNARTFSDALLNILDEKKNAKRLDEVSKTTLAFFLEREDNTDEVPLLLAPRSQKREAPKRVKRPTKPVNSLRPSPTKKEGLQLDIKKVRDLERSKTDRQNAIRGSIDSGRTLGEGFLLVSEAVTFMLSGLLIGAFLPTKSVPLRFMFSVSPIIVALLSTAFSPMSRPSETIMEQWIEPTLARSLPIFFSIFIVAFLVFPEHAAFATREHMNWILSDASKMGVIGESLSNLGSLFASLFSLASRILPW